MSLFMSVQILGEEASLPVDMSFLEYLGAMIEVDGQLLDVTEVFPQEIQDAGQSARIENNNDTSAELPVGLPEVRQ
jgi:hypothetical protein